MGTRRVQEPSLSLVVAGGGLEVCVFSCCMCKIYDLLFEKSFLVTIFHVSNRYSISPIYR